MAKTKRRKGIEQLKNGDFRARFRYGPREGQKSIYFTGEYRDCDAWRAEMKRRRAADEELFAPMPALDWPPKSKEVAVAGPQNECTTIQQLIEDYKKHPDRYQFRAPRTKKEIDATFRVFLEWCVLNDIRYVDQMQATGEDYYGWIAKRFEGKEYALLRHVKRAKQLFKFALARRRKDSRYCTLEFNPLEDCKPPIPTAPEIRFLSKEVELPALRDHMSIEELRPFGTEDFRRGIWELMYYCAMRPGELCNLRDRFVFDDHILIARTSEQEAVKDGGVMFTTKVRKASDSFNRIELHPKAKEWIEYFRKLNRQREFIIGFRSSTFAPPPLDSEIVKAIVEYIEEVDRPTDSKELFEVLTNKGVIERSPRKTNGVLIENPIRYLGIRLASSESGGRLYRLAPDKYHPKQIYGFRRHFQESGAVVVQPNQQVEYFRPLIRRTGPYLIGGDRPLLAGLLSHWYDRLTEKTMAVHPVLNLRDTFPKTFRKSRASHMLQHGIPLEVVSRFLRHSSISVTERHYASLLREDIQKAVAAVP